MRPSTLCTGLMLMLAGSLAAPARAQDDYRHGRVLSVEAGVSLQRASGVSAEEADVNTPFLPGDRVWTDSAGRVEFQFPDGSLARLDRRSKLDYAGHDEDGGERIGLRLWSGSLYARVNARDARFEIETPAGTARGLERSLMRIDVDAGEVRVSVYEGEALFDDGQLSMRLAAGERTYARWGERAEEPQRFDLDEADEFDRWNADQESQQRWDERSAQYLPDELDVYAGELDNYGDWRHETSVGYVWVPRVEVGWRPYSHGRWVWTPYGWTWVPHERWGWAPSHYGRWGHGSVGWYWIPGRSWGPAWVSWAVGGGYVGWCPLGWRDRPVRDWDHWRHDRGHAVPRRGRGRDAFDAWNVVRQAELGHRDLAQRRISVDRIDPGALQVAASARFRPTRDAVRLRESEATVRAIRTRPTAGDFVRELAVDNKTTIRSPWFRSGAVPRSEPQMRQGSDDAASRATPGARRRSDDAPRGAVRRGDDSRGTQRRAPWSSPAAGAPAANPAGTSESTAGAERRAPSSSEQRHLRRETQDVRSGAAAQPRAREQAPAPPAARSETGRPRDAQLAPPASRGGESQRSRGDAGASRRQDGGGTHGSDSRASGGQARSRGGAGGAGHAQGGDRAQSGGRAERRGRR